MISEGTDLWIEAEVRRIDALVEADMKVESGETSRQNFAKQSNAHANWDFRYSSSVAYSACRISSVPRKDMEIEAQIKSYRICRILIVVSRPRSKREVTIVLHWRINSRFENWSRGYAWSICRPLFSFAGFVRCRFARQDRSTFRR